MTAVLTKNGVSTLAYEGLSTTPCSKWNAAFKAFVLADAACRAESRFGAYAHASEEYESVRAGLKKYFGTAELHLITEAKLAYAPQWKALTDAADRREEKLFPAIWETAAALAQTPAPTIAAVLFKIELIEREQLDNCGYMSREPIDIINEDIERLTASVTKTDPVEEYWSARDAYNASPDDTDEEKSAEKRHLETYDALVDWAPPTLLDFARKIEALFHGGGVPNPVACATFLADAARLLGHQSKVPTRVHQAQQVAA